MKMKDTTHCSSTSADGSSPEEKRERAGITECFKTVTKILKTESINQKQVNEALQILDSSVHNPVAEHSPVILAGIMKLKGVVLYRSAEFCTSLSDQEKTIDAAIHAFYGALEIYIRVQRPAACAGTFENIGIAYCRLAVFHENCEENCEKDFRKDRGMGIQAFKRALEIATVEKYPAVYAKIQNDIGITYNERIYFCNHLKDLNRSIHAFKKALGVSTVNKYPFQYAGTQNNLGTVYSELTQFPDSKININRSLYAFKGALSVYSFEKYPVEYTKTQIRLAEAYKRFGNYYYFKQDRDVQSVQACAEQAVQSYCKALRIYTVADYPPACYAETNKKIADIHRILADICNGEENAEQAVQAYHKALRVYTFETYPSQYKEIQSFEEALSRDTDKNSFASWQIQRTLGDTYSELAQIQNTEKNRKRAIQAYEKVLHDYAVSVFTEAQVMLLFEKTIALHDYELENPMWMMEKEIWLISNHSHIQESTPVTWQITHGTKSGNSRKEKYRNTTITKCFKQITEILKLRHVLQDRHDNFDMRDTGYERITQDQYNLYQKFLCILDSMIHNPAAQKSPVLFARIKKIYGIVLCRPAAFFGDSLLDRDKEKENIDKAIHVFKEALETYTYGSYPVQYAETLKYIGIAYKKRVNYQDGAPDEESVNAAILAFEESLKVYTAEIYPIQYAFVQKNRGIVYKKLARSRDSEENLNNAEQALKEALKIYNAGFSP